MMLPLVRRQLQKWESRCAVFRLRETDSPTAYGLVLQSFITKEDIGLIHRYSVS